MVPANPAAGVKLPDRVRRHLQGGGRKRVLSDEEIGVLWAELEELEANARRRKFAPVSAAAFRLILLTAQRPGEVFRMRWCDIKDGVWWVVPAEVAKNGQANRVYLSPQAQAILGELRPATGGSEWVLESPRKRGTHLTTIKTATLSILERSQMDHWTPHDLRRTAATRISALGTDRRVLQAILNHKDRSVTAIYDHYTLDPEKQEALVQWGRRLEQITGGEPGAQVVEFRARGGAGR
jgi:integrase